MKLTQLQTIPLQAASRTAVADYFSKAIQAFINIKTGALMVEDLLVSMSNAHVYTSVISDDKVEWFVSFPTTNLVPFFEKKLRVGFKPKAHSYYETRVPLTNCSALLILGDRPVSGNPGSVVTLTDFHPGPDL